MTSARTVAAAVARSLAEWLRPSGRPAYVRGMPNAYRADQVGSFLRPAELVDARHSNAAADTVRGLEDRHILRLLERQRELGLDVVTDGELRRSNFMSDLWDAVDGFAMVGELNLPEKDEAKIFGENSVKLFKLSDMQRTVAA